ncbi:MAG: hypothetical protein J0M10_15845 [Chitinophagales bacterium]|nr:hypothetical protein [Chitinophagales bacterium]
MSAKKTIRKIAFITVWVCIAGGMFTLLMAAISSKNKGRCSGYSITINDVEKNYFIDQKDVEALLMKAAGGAVKGQLLASLNLYELETSLERNTWIRDAELYVDKQDHLHVTISEKEPIARIFTTAGSSFYIDKSGKKMPLSEKLSARVPVFTGFPDKKKLNSDDSVLLSRVTNAALFILRDSFWLAQVTQMDITPERNFEMIPLVGNHVVKMDAARPVEQQFQRLFTFYNQVLSKTGFERYKVINVQYAGQVVASRFAGNAKVDSVQLRRNVEQLLKQSRDAEADTVARILPGPAIPLATDAADEPPVQEPAATRTTDNITNRNPNPVNTPVTPKPGSSNKPAAPKPKPKAQMPPRTTEDANGGYN